MKKRKLVVGDIVRAKFLGSTEICTVTEVENRNTYKLCTANGIKLPGAKWKADAEKKAPWYITEYVGKKAKVNPRIINK